MVSFLLQETIYAVLLQSPINHQSSCFGHMAGIPAADILVEGDGTIEHVVRITATKMPLGLNREA
jgi:hypothetical protein